MTSTASRLGITADERVIQSLVPTDDSEPDVLAASAPVLAPGRYRLHWHGKSVPDGDFSEGLMIQINEPQPGRVASDRIACVGERLRRVQGV